MISDVKSRCLIGLKDFNNRKKDRCDRDLVVRS